MESASLFRDKPASEQRNLTVFRATMIGREEVSWRELFAGFETLKAITYSSGLDLILELTGMLQDVEVTFGSERILSREHAALEQASHIARGYTFVDAVADQNSGGGRAFAIGADGALLCAIADGSRKSARRPAQPARNKEAES